ncbi:hypothetical protein D8674_030865 [Pyrus ussuriensis x Pyrus communis]|uniref:Uncharacterized protein n=1 Tax=Pyrus ussuriensis x Pyrus communis TaxID=2448454 RepID=A0A5N5EXD8_9ROSA|nr:hypothetical protein D8674_030865 [Pyrus ussuriensis x Pyrus communis]
MIPSAMAIAQGHIVPLAPLFLGLLCHELDEIHAMRSRLPDPSKRGQLLLNFHSAKETWESKHEDETKDAAGRCNISREGRCRRTHKRRSKQAARDIDTTTTAKHKRDGGISRLFAERYNQWKGDMHQHFEMFDDPQVALEEDCPREFEDREENWVWLRSHFEEPTYVKAKANKIIQEKKTFLHHLGSRPFSYRMETVGSSGVRLPATPPPDTLIESVDPSKDAGFHILTDILDQTLGRRPKTRGDNFDTRGRWP